MDHDNLYDSPYVNASIEVDNVEDALKFYGRAFGAVTTAADYDEGDGKIHKAQMKAGNHLVNLYEGKTQKDKTAPYLFSCEASSPGQTFVNAIDAGCESVAPVNGNKGTVKDPYGHMWDITGGDE